MFPSELAEEYDVHISTYALQDREWFNLAFRVPPAIARYSEKFVIKSMSYAYNAQACGHSEHRSNLILLTYDSHKGIRLARKKNSAVVPTRIKTSLDGNNELPCGKQYVGGDAVYA